MGDAFPLAEQKLVGCDASDEILHFAAEQTGLKIAGNLTREAVLSGAALAQLSSLKPSRLVFLCRPGFHEGLDLGLAAGCAVVVESCPEFDFGHKLSTLGWRESRALFLTSRSAFAYPLVEKFVQVLLKLSRIKEERAADIELALTEAVSNCLIHDNLEIHSENRISLEGFEDFSASIDRRLNEDRLGLRSIGLAAHLDDSRLVCKVVGEGEGCPSGAKAGGNVREAVKSAEMEFSGRGLSLIAAVSDAVSFSENGNILTIRFAP